MVDSFTMFTDPAGVRIDTCLTVVCLECRRRTDLPLLFGNRLRTREIRNALVCPDCQSTARSGGVLFERVGRQRTMRLLGNPDLFGLTGAQQQQASEARHGLQVYDALRMAVGTLLTVVAVTSLLLIH